MEFDNNIRLKEVSFFEMASAKTEERLWQEIWEDLRKHFRNVGHAGNGEFWIDYSTALRTQYLVCKINRCPQAGGPEKALPAEAGKHAEAAAAGSYTVRIYCGTKAGRITDVVMLLVLLGAFWFLSKSVVPSPSVFNILMIVFCLLVVAGLVYLLNVPFGRKEAAAIERLIRKRK